MKKFVLLLLLLCGTLVFAENQTVAVVDLDRIFREYYKTGIIEANLKRQADVYTEYAAKMQEEIRRLQNEFNTLRDAAQNVVLTETARESKKRAAADVYEKLNSKQQELREYSREKQAQLRDDQEKQRAGILEEIQNVVRNQAVLTGVKLVLDKNAFSAAATPCVLYSEKSLDMTDSVIRELNDGHREKSAEKPVSTEIKK